MAQSPDTTTHASDSTHVSDSTPPTLEQRLEDLDQRVRILARLRELKDDSIAAWAKTQPIVTVGKDGFGLRSADGAFALRIRGYIQADTRFYTGSSTLAATSSILLRRVRPIIEGTLYKRFDFRFMPDFGNGTTVLYDGYSEARLWPALAIRIGKFKPPIGLERLQSATDIKFVERGLPTNLVPNRDVGVQLSGDVAGGFLTYQGGVFNGVADLGNGDGDATNSKDLVGRVFVQPFVRSALASRVDLGVGVAVSSGVETGTLTAPALPSYRTPGQLTFFKYRNDGTAPNTVIADGRRTRLAPQGYLNVGPLGLLSEYIRSSQHVIRATTSADLEHTAWQVAGSWFLTGERASFKSVTPKTNAGSGANGKPGGVGAIELVARYGVLSLDDATFPAYANPTSAPSDAKAWGAGVNWHLAKNIKFLVDYEYTKFTGGATTGNRAPERFIVSRFQTAF